jgi:hypothetical protein
MFNEANATFGSFAMDHWYAYVCIQKNPNISRDLHPSLNEHGRAPLPRTGKYIQ